MTTLRSIATQEIPWVVLATLTGCAFFWSCQYLDARKARIVTDAQLEAVRLNQEEAALASTRDEMTATLIHLAGEITSDAPDVGTPSSPGTHS